MKVNRLLPNSRHFRLEELADGVYAAIHIDGGAATSNAGIIDLGDRTLVFDAFFTPQASEDLRSAAEEITGRPVDAAIDSHYHSDHTWGNQTFSQGTDIISTAATRELIATQGIVNSLASRENAAANLRSTQAQYEAAEDDRERCELALWVDYYQAFLEAAPTLRLSLPNVTFAERMAWHGASRSAELMCFDGGHTASDCVLWLPNEGIVFMGDLLFVDHHPYLGDGDPDEWLRVLEAIRGLNPNTLVPGHGPVGAPAYLKPMSQYVGTLDELARKMLQDGETEERIADIAIPEPFANWRFAPFFVPNMQFLYQRQRSKPGSVSM